MYAIYSVLTVAFFVVVSPYLLYQALRYRKYIANLPQRLGYLPLSFNLDGDQSTSTGLEWERSHLSEADVSPPARAGWRARG